MNGLGRRLTIVVFAVLVCLALSFAAGCSHSIIQEDGQDRSLAKLTLGGEKGLRISLGEGPTSTRVTTEETEQILQNSKKPTAIDADVQKALIKKEGDLGERVLVAMKR